MDENAVDPEAVKRKLWIDYQYSGNEKPNDFMASVQGLVSSLTESSSTIRKLVQDVVRLIHDKMWIKEVTLGLKDPADGLYRYEAMAGLREGTWQAHKSIAYTFEQFNDPKLYRAKQISRYTRLYLSEDNPYGEGEVETYNKPVMLQMRRKALDDSIEGDYVDIGILGERDELVGWIEISGTMTGKLPDVTTIRVIELIASVVGLAVVKDREMRRVQPT